MLLCEANQWPADVVEYFGEDGDECQMAFHFPVMPRLFMAVRREQRFPISEIMAQTPAIPENCQWGVFLRKRRADPRDGHRRGTRLHVGRVRQGPPDEGQHRHPPAAAPLLDNDTNTLELFTALLLSLPGSPVLTTATRSGWATTSGSVTATASAPRCSGPPTATAGFSTADPQRMHLPLVADPVYGYQVTNVEQQMRNTTSMLHWIRRMISVPQGAPDFGIGTFTEVGSRNPTVLSFVREFGDDVVLCVNNLSRFPQPVELDLRRFEGCIPVELTGRVEFPTIGVLPYMLTLAGHGFYWFELSRPAAPATDEDDEAWETATSSSVAQSLLDAGIVGSPDDPRGGSGGLGVEGSDR